MKSNEFQIYEWTTKSDIERHIEKVQNFQPINADYAEPKLQEQIDVPERYLDAHMGTYW
jgi:hypothetical protein